MNKLKILTIFIIISAIAQIPLLKLLLYPPNGYKAIGGSLLLSPADVNVYFSAVKQGELGNFLYTNAFTTIDNAKILIFPIYILIGHIVRLIHAKPQVVFLIIQFISGIIFLFSIWTLGSFLFKKRSHQVIFFLTSLTVTGYGWVIILLINYLPPLFFAKYICSGLCYSIDLWTTGATVLPLLSTVPHATLSASLIIFIAIFLSKYLKNADARNGFILILLSFLLSILSNYHLILVGLIFLLTMLTNFSKIRKYKALPIATLIIAIRVIYLSIVLNSNLSFSNWIKSSPLYSPPFPSLLIGWAGLILLSLFAWKKIPKNQPFQIVKITLFLALILTILPTPIARNFVLTIPVFLAVIATCGLIAIFSKKKKHLIKTLIILLMVLATLDNFLILIPSLDIPSRIARDPSFGFLFLSKKEDEGLKWLSVNSNRNDGVITDYRLGNIIPTQTGTRVFWGHWSQSGSPNNQYKYKWVLKGESREEIEKFLKENKIKWVVSPKKDIAFGKINKETHPFLNLVLSNEELEIYKVN